MNREGWWKSGLTRFITDREERRYGIEERKIEKPGK